MHLWKKGGVCNPTFHLWRGPMNTKNWLLVASKLVEVDMYLVQVHDFKIITDHFRIIYRIILNLIKNRELSRIKMNNNQPMSYL